MHLLGNQPLQQLDSEILLLHLGDFLQELRIEQGKARFHIGKEIDDAVALDALLQKLIDALVHLRQGNLLALALMGEP